MEPNRLLHDLGSAQVLYGQFLAKFDLDYDTSRLSFSRSQPLATR